MFNTLKRMYDQEKIDETGLQNAVSLGWITQEQYNEVVGTE